MEKHATAGLGGNNDQDAQQVGSETRPGSIGKRHDSTIDKRLYLVVPLSGNDEVVAFHFDLHAQTAESIGDDAKILHTDILNTDAVAAHGSHADERADLNHVGQNLMLCAV